MPPVNDSPALFGTGPRGAWLTLRAIHAVSSRRWCRYVTCSDRMKGHHVLDLAKGGDVPHHRLIHRDEVWWWALGMAAGHGDPEAVEGLRSERGPKLLDGKAAAVALGISEAGIRGRWRGDDLYPIYVVDLEDHHKRRMVFAAQASGRGWDDLRAKLPDQPRPAQLSERITPRCSPDPLPVSPLLRSPIRQREALALAVELGWIVGFTASPEAFAVRLSASSRTVPTRGVLPYLLGLGDAREGQGRLVAYREWLG